MLDATEIRKLLPHRWPFLMVDRIVELEPGIRGVGIKNVTVNETIFQGHFPSRPIFPGVLIIEALAQVGGIVVLSQPEFKGRLGVLAGVDGFRFRRQVVPGDTLRLEFKLTKTARGVVWGEGTARVDGITVAEGQVTFAMVKETTDDAPQR